VTVDDRFAGDAEVVRQLGAARRLDAQEERAAIDSYRGGDLWCTREETIKLSLIEAKTLAERYAEALDGEARARLASAIESALVAAFEEVHAGRASLADVRASWKATVHRAIDRTEGLTETQRAAAKAAVK
jgi:hypothetical protein